MLSRIRGLVKFISSVRYKDGALFLELDCDLVMISRVMKSTYIYKFDNCSEEFIEDVIANGPPPEVHPEVVEECLVQ